MDRASSFACSATPIFGETVSFGLLRPYGGKTGIGTALLRDAILRTLNAAEHVGMAALLVHALSEDARRFYRSRGFLDSPLQRMTLCLPLATVRQAYAKE